MSVTQDYKILNRATSAATVANLLAAVAGSLMIAAPFAAYMLGGIS